MTSLQFQQNDNLMYYGTISTGYKSGGYAGSQGLRIFADREVKPEGVINYEIGFKGEFADNSLRLNASAFYMDYTDLQVVRFGPVAISPFGTFQTTNIGSAEITGIEIDYLWQATDAFSLSGYYAYLDSEVNDLTLNSATGPQDFSGVPLRQSPEHSYSIIGEYIADMSGGSALTFRAQYAFVDDQFNDYPTPDETIIGAAKLLDASIKWMSAEGQYELVLWGKNLTDERYISHSYRIGPGSIGVWSDPRTFGLTGTFHF
jgi:iron complex outermembrane receptor protein